MQAIRIKVDKNKATIKKKPISTKLQEKKNSEIKYKMQYTKNHLVIRKEFNKAV